MIQGNNAIGNVSVIRASPVLCSTYNLRVKDNSSTPKNLEEEQPSPEQAAEGGATRANFVLGNSHVRNDLIIYLSLDA